LSLNGPETGKKGEKKGFFPQKNTFVTILQSSGKIQSVELKEQEKKFT